MKRETNGNERSKTGRKVVLGLAALLAAAQVQAAGLLLADGGLGGVLEMKEHEVHVTINNGVAVTKVTQVFQNTESRQVEALYTFPVPKGASVAGFSMWINGKEMVGEVLEKARAREIYNSYKRQNRDPGLLEQTDYRTFEMRIFPIGPKAEQKVQLVYYQELEPDHDWATYVYPLATATRPGVDSRVRGKLAIDFEVKSAIPIEKMESPSHSNEFAVARHSENYCQASLEARGGDLNRDFVLAYRTVRPVTGFDLVTSRADKEDGFFCLMLTAGEDLAKLDKGMDYAFVLDVSGSMGSDGKLAVSRESVAAFIEELDEADRFEVMTFNVRPNLLFRELRPATEAHRKQAQDFLSTQEGRGGTALNPALQAAYRYADPDRPLTVLILSDGLTEQGERQTLMDLIGKRPRNCRVFCVGVGNDVNRPLLEQMAKDSGGLAAFVSRGDNFERQAKAFRRKLQHPVASELSLDIQGVDVYDLEPSTMPNLFHGTPVRVYGRFRGTGAASVTLKGNIRGRELKTTAKLEFPERDPANPEIERMWANGRIDRLAKLTDNASTREAAVAEIIRLGEAFSITSEWTSFLVLENDVEYARWKIDRRNELRLARDRRAQDQRRSELNKIRDRAAADLGPQPVLAAAERPDVNAGGSRQPAVSVPTSSRAPMNVPTQPNRNSRQSWDFRLPTGGGSSPVGPIFVAVAAWLARRKQLKG